MQENVYAGNAMNRRATYMYGAQLDRGRRPARWAAGSADDLDRRRCRWSRPPSTSPTHGPAGTPSTGCGIEFQITPGTEAPAEMNSISRDYRALCMAENATHNLHNLLTLRGALVRDPQCLGAATSTRRSTLFAERDRRGVRLPPLADLGTRTDRRIPVAAAGPVRVPARPDAAAAQPGLHRSRDRRDVPAAARAGAAWHARGYYGSVSHNVKAVYQRYMGWFDGNPARLWQHPPEEAAGTVRRVPGGVDAIIG